MSRSWRRQRRLRQGRSRPTRRPGRRGAVGARGHVPGASGRDLRRSSTMAVELRELGVRLWRCLVRRSLVPLIVGCGSRPARAGRGGARAALRPAATPSAPRLTRACGARVGCAVRASRRSPTQADRPRRWPRRSRAPNVASRSSSRALRVARAAAVEPFARPWPQSCEVSAWARASSPSLSERERSSSGADEVAFLIRPNPGLPLAPVAQTASGGELSRIALAIAASGWRRDDDLRRDRRRHRRSGLRTRSPDTLVRLAERRRS